MNRSKIVAIITGAISILLAIAYLIIVQILDYRDMKPAPISQIEILPVALANLFMSATHVSPGNFHIISQFKTLIHQHLTYLLT
jgi:hypothetical protein